MKKIILSSMIVMAGISIAQAQSTPDTVTKEEPKKETVYLAQATQDTYKEVSIEALPEAITASIKANYAEHTLKSASINEEKRVYRLVLLNKDGQEQVILMSEEGKVQE